MIVVCLDDSKPVTRNDVSWNCWVGNGKNRFYDKHQRKSTLYFLCLNSSHITFPVIVFENGKSGFLGEHSCIDGTPTLRMNEFILAALAERSFHAIKNGPRHPVQTLRRV